MASTPVLSITKVQDLGTAVQFLPLQTQLSITVPAGGVAAGNSVIVTFVMDVGSGGVTVTDSGSNVYTTDADAAVVVGSLRRTMIFAAHGVNPLAGGGTITVTFPASTAKAFGATEFSGLASTGALDRTSVNSNLIPNGAPTSGLTALTSQADELLIGAIGVLQPGASGFTPGSGWTGLPRAGTSNGTGDVTIDPEYQIVSAIAQYQADGSLAASALWSAAIATYRAASPTPTPTFTPSFTPTFTPSSTATFTPTVTASATSTPSQTPTSTPSLTPTNTPSLTPSNTSTPSPTATNIPSSTPTTSQTPTSTPSLTPTNTPSLTPSNTSTPSPTATNTSSSTPTASRTPTVTPSASATRTGTSTASPTSTPTATATGTPTASPSPIGTVSATPTSSATPTPSHTPGPGLTATQTPEPPAEIPASSPGSTLALAVVLAAAALWLIRRSL